MNKQEYDKKAKIVAQMAAIDRCEAMRNVSGQRNRMDLAAVMTEEQRKRHTAKLDETRQLKWRKGDYLTDVDVSSPCEQITEWPLYLFNHQTHGVDIDQFREDCKGIDNEEKRI